MAKQSFDARVGEESKVEVIDAVEEAAPIDFMEAAHTSARYLAKTRDEFTTDAIWFLLEKGGVLLPPEPRALGAVMRAAAKAGIIEATDRTSRSVRARCHRRPIRVWRSKVR